jgi:WD40 repeat protein
LKSSRIDYYDSSSQNLTKTVSHFHTDDIKFLKYLSINGYVASASNDTTINVWDPNTWLSIRHYKNHSKMVFGLDQIDNDTIASVSLDRTIHVWSISTGKTLKIINAGLAHYVKTLSNGLIVCGLASTFNNLMIYNYSSGELVNSLNGHNDSVESIEVLNEKFLASGSLDSKVIIWDLKRNLSKFILIGHNKGVTCLKRVSSNLLASADSNGSIIIWDWSTGSIHHILKGHTSTLWRSSLDLFDHQTLISGSNDKKIKFWNIFNGTLMQTLDSDINIIAIATIKKSGSF